MNKGENLRQEGIKYSFYTVHSGVTHWRLVPYSGGLYSYYRLEK